MRGIASVSAEPIRPILRNMGRRLAEESPSTRNDGAGGCTPGSGLLLLGRVIADRYGTNHKSEAKYLWRIMTGQQNIIDIDKADRLAIAIGLHPLLIWGEEWTCAAISA